MSTAHTFIYLHDYFHHKKESKGLPKLLINITIEEKKHNLWISLLLYHQIDISLLLGI
jgi:hypothetical protein